MDNNKICIRTLLDLSAAFGLQHSFGICGSALSWLSSYLCNRTHAVTINNLQSQHTTLHSGVPQGSVLGPVFFILYTQPLFNLVSKHAVNHHSFADDNQLYKISTLDAIHQVIETLQNCTTGFILLVVSMQQCWLQSAVRMYTAMLASVCCLYACSNAGFSLLSVCMQHCWLQSSVCMYAANVNAGFSLLSVCMQHCWLQSSVCIYAANVYAGFSLLSVCMQQCWLHSAVCMYVCSNAGFSLLSVCMQQMSMLASVCCPYVCSKCQRWLQSAVRMYAANVNAGFNLLFVCMQQCWLQSAVCMYAAMLASVCCLYVCSNAGFNLLSVCMQQCWLQSAVCMYAADNSAISKRWSRFVGDSGHTKQLHFVSKCFPPFSAPLHVPSPICPKRKYRT